MKIRIQKRGELKMGLDAQLSFHDAISPRLQERYRSTILRQELTRQGLIEVPVTITEASMRREDGDISPNKLRLYLSLDFEDTGKAEVVYSQSQTMEHLLQMAGVSKIKELEGMRFKAYLKDKEVLALRKYH